MKKVPPVVCNACWGEVPDTQAARSAHVAWHQRVALRQVVEKVAGWSCPGPLVPFRPTPLSI